MNQPTMKILQFKYWKFMCSDVLILMIVCLGLFMFDSYELNNYVDTSIYSFVDLHTSSSYIHVIKYDIVGL